MTSPSGFTLPVWVAAAARAAVQALVAGPDQAAGPLDPAPLLELLDPPGLRPVPVEAAARLGGGTALGISRCQPGEGLDLTRDLAIWVWASAWPAGEAPPRQGTGEWLRLEAGEGVGVHAGSIDGGAGQGGSSELCLSNYARQLLDVNLRPLWPDGEGLRLRIIFPQGRRLAERTSNAAFGVVDGLALIGTQAIVQRSAAPDQLEACLAELRQRAAAPGFSGNLVVVIGENGLDLAPRLGLPAELLLKAGNWLGPVIVAAGEAGVRQLILFGYHGKLIKLAGGIFHTHHHLADGRAEILTSLAALEGVSGEPLAQLHGAATVEAALAGLALLDPQLAARLEQRLADTIEQRSQAYLARYGDFDTRVGAVLFDQARQLRACGSEGKRLLQAFGHPLG
ncbi:cobalt-precorrin-5B (C(1))-methyltransferase CbiD [Synechococcus sp. CS-602]|nr:MULTISPECIES: cobalt-precorrin-5B (C(1))-methyltransferase CbiD [Synechococcaceae]MCT4364823.1 cobalt-precorrin-5B (C(1))-methyltransferase CbiD [Candidatus Regnicoccus frigidus MAG-AL1]MCT0203327.1 cobalt-precorrin-5B (C(1))-methyltransferase CbiD [Synechococcus sp. CS-603]MCT0203975.1 cobalt-precorrin-5B (C(1))-methyltransferase CbiD [Synechococcus sp. CS-602]MCT0246547.1 cobalt-precorrin-5B (C(1))-methyltransferase CbiD [Synechococcus sp. CS-601]MCT4368506.1 cobalt-precorrin-5B (C(1))-me